MASIAMSGTRAGPRHPFGRLAANRLNRVWSLTMTATSSAGRANTEVPASPGAERPFRDAGKLTPRQARFVDEYLIDLNATQAAIRAGYSAKNADKIGPKLVGKSRVAEAIEKAIAARSERTQVTQDWVLKTIYDTVERCKQAKPVLDRQGDPVYVETPDGDMAPAYTFDSGAVLKGAEIAGRHLQMFKDIIQIENVFELVRALDDDDLDRRIAELERALAEAETLNPVAGAGSTIIH